MEVKMKMKVWIMFERLDNGIVFRWEDIDGIEGQKNLVFADVDKESGVGEEVLDDIKCVMDANCTNMVEATIEYKPILKTEKEGGING